MKPGPLISTAAQTSSSDGRGDHLGGHLAGGAAHLLGQGQGAVGLEVGPVRGAQHRVGPGVDGVEGGLEALEENAECVGHLPLSHPVRCPFADGRPQGGRRTSVRAGARQSAGAPTPPSVSP